MREIWKFDVSLSIVVSVLLLRIVYRKNRFNRVGQLPTKYKITATRFARNFQIKRRIS